jgi:alpha-tubulin suppressor-like RCC1 family protein
VTEADNYPTRVDFFKDINLEVLSVHCGRSHTLFLTNNGLYAMGSNQQGQLGIDRLMNNALQPMLIKELDGKIITQICAGQHHNAVVADNLLYTWGWNIYGQLGHGDIKLVRQPKVVEFFKDKKIKQVALGQAHTIVLTSEKVGELNTSVYVFGSNHYGQLGVGEEGEMRKSISTSAVPLRIKMSENIRLIHTNYFVNYAVTETNKLLTWGLSPPELRIINQSKKRAKANQKLKENNLQENGNVGVNENEPQETPVESTSSSTDENSGIETADIAVEITTNQPQVPEIKIDEAPTDDSQQSTSSTNKESSFEINEEQFSAEEFIGHLRPSEVDTSSLDGDIIYISSGIYHYALITTQSSLFMWGKNIERQLGRESVKPDLIAPTKHQSLVDAKFVECGADFTLIVTNENELKTFGNNNNGQCGVENTADKAATAGKLIRFKSSKRVFRIPESSMYLHHPVNVRLTSNAPSNYIDFSDNQPICYLKNLPKFRKNCIIESSLGKLMRKEHNLHLIDDHIINNNCNSFSSLSSIESSNSGSSNDSIEIADIRKSNDFVHYCLFLFQGLYDSTRFYCKNVDKIVSSEYKIRVLMLEFNYIEAFKMTLNVEGTNASTSIKIFEYFTTDSNIIPMHTDDIKYFIYDVFLHFIKNQFDVAELEKYFIYNLDYYFLQLAFILYFCGSNNNNNNNNAAQQQNGLEKQLFDKFKHLYSNHENFAYLTTMRLSESLNLFQQAFIARYVKVC